MRLKSYFAPSVQAAIGMARREFGDEITLVTSHVAPADARHLGEYEVLFDVEEPQELTVQAMAAATAPVAVQKSAVTGTPATIAEPMPAPFTAFQETLLQAVTPKPAAEEEKAQKLRQIRFTLIELGVEAGLTRAIMGMLEGSIGKRTPRKPAPATAVAAAVEPVMTAEPIPVTALPEVAVAAPLPAMLEAAPAATPPSLAVFEVPAEEPVAAPPSSKVVVISRRREMQLPVAASERAGGSLAATTEQSPAMAAPVPAGGPTAAELAFIASLSGDSAESPLGRRAVGC